MLGKSIYIPEEDLLGSIPNGIVFFEEIPVECFGKAENPTLLKSDSFYQNTENFFKSVATELNLNAQVTKIFSLGTTLDATTKSIGGDHHAVNGASLKIATKHFDTQLSSVCLYETNIQTRVLDDFSELPSSIGQPWFKESWREYDIFLQTHGSHVITSVTYGSSLDQYAFGEESSSYTQKQLTTKACAALPGEIIGAAGLSLSACAGLNKEDKDNISNAKMTTSITVRGGTIETRNRLFADTSADVILKFLSEGNTSPAPIRYKVTPIWQVLMGQKQVKQSNPKRSVQAANLQYYFEGFLNFDCPYIPSDDEGPIFQLFNYAEHSTPERPAFQCTIAPEGCHHDKDCHRALGTGCLCYGKSSVRHHSIEKDGAMRLVAQRQITKDWEGDKTCSRKNVVGKCFCKHERLKRKVIFG